jgi:hypothetical protein
MKLPNFLIVGAAKAGTTSLYQYLNQHPDIYMPSRIKETFFFSGITAEKFPGMGHEYAKSAITNLDKYLELFSEAKEQKAIGEACVAYLYYYEISLKRILALLGKNIKIIICLRHPVDRSYSNYLHHVREGWETLSFLEAIKAESWRKEKGWWWGFEYLPVSQYYSQVKAYLDVFGKERTLIILYEDLLEDQLGGIQKIFQFLDVDNSFVPDTSKKYNQSLIPRNQTLHKFINKPNQIMSILKRKVPHHLLKQMTDNLNTLNLTEPPKLPAEERRKLIPLYQEDILKLQDLIQRDLTHWLE